MKNKSLDSAIRLFDYLSNNFWNGHAIMGPTAGIMFELRIYRFIKSCLSFLNWADDHYFLQAQGYWIKSNWDLFEITGEMKYKKAAIDCSKHVIAKQKNSGSWEAPLKLWKNYVVTLEGTWGSLGLLETFKRIRESIYLEGALKWHDFLINRIGFQHYRNSLAVNYFNAQGLKVSNCTTLVLWFLAELANTVNDARFSKFNDKIIDFILLSQNKEGELRYAIEREHYFCYQYNAFEFLDLSEYYRITNNKRILTVLEKLAKYLSRGVTEIGSIRYNCFQRYPEIIYVSAAVGTALITATLMGLGNYREHVKRAYNFLFGCQRSDGSFPFSRRDFPYIRTPTSYGVLSDNRSYVRSLCYILQHLLIKAKSETNLMHPRYLGLGSSY